MPRTGTKQDAALALVTVSAILLGPVTLAVIDSGSPFAVTASQAAGRTLLLIAGWALALAALIVGRRPNRRAVSVLLGLGSLAWYATDWPDPTTSSLVFTAGLGLHAAAPAVVGHLAMTYPSGRLRGRRPTLIVASGYAVAIVLLGIGPALFFDPVRQGCFGCARSAWTVDDNASLSDLVYRVGAIAEVTWTLVLLGYLISRFVLDTSAGRRATVLFAVAASAYLSAVGVASLAGVRRGFLDRGDADTTLWRWQGLALVSIGLAVLLDVVRVRWMRRAMSRLVVDLGLESHVDLRAGLAARLHDPDLLVAYPVAEGRYVDAGGVDVRLDTPGRGRTELRVGSSELAVLSHRPGAFESSDLAADLGAAMRLGLENERLQAQALVQLADIRASGLRLLNAGDSERRRLERDLHDGAQQRVIGVLLALRLARARGDMDGTDLDRADELIRQAIAELRDLAHGIHPVLLADAGLAAALNALSETHALTVDGIVSGRWPDVIEATVYEFVATAVTTGAARVRVDSGDGVLIVQMTWEGHATDLNAVQQRVSALSGALTLDRDGTTAVARMILPVA